MTPVVYRVFRRKWQKYDPAWLLSLAEEQHPDKPWLAKALARCTKCIVESRSYIYFVSPGRPNEPDSAWQFTGSLSMESPVRGVVVLDILRGERVGGVDFSSNG